MKAEESLKGLSERLGFAFSIARDEATVEVPPGSRGRRTSSVLSRCGFAGSGEKTLTRPQVASKEAASALEVALLEEMLADPQPGEIWHAPFVKRVTQPGPSRTETLKRLKAMESEGTLSPVQRLQAVNTHLHTGESFGILRTPTEAAWLGYRAGLAVIGINDHYAIGGHAEFAEACRALGAGATFSMEAVALLESAKDAGITVNDPKNPGRTYLSAKGIVRALKPGSEHALDLQGMRDALRARNMEMVELLDGILASLPGGIRLRYGQVEALTPHGNVTERHVVQALAEAIEDRFPSPPDRDALVRQLAGDFEAGTLDTDAGFQNFLRDRLLKAGCRAYVEERPEAFLPVEKMVRMFLEMGAIPSYPVLGNPVTPFEEDIEVLLDRIEGMGMHAIEVIPHRNSYLRLRAICDAAESRRMPIFTGTEHNTKTPMPFVDKFSGSEEFSKVFMKGAQVLLGHQVISRAVGVGYVKRDGSLSIADSARLVSAFSSIGELALAAAGQPAA